jgi:hypothetical protein
MDNKLCTVCKSNTVDFNRLGTNCYCYGCFEVIYNSKLNK